MKIKPPPADDLIQYMATGNSPGFGPPNEHHYLRVQSWLYRLGNAQNPVGQHTVISVYGTAEQGAATGAYLVFQRAAEPVRTPLYDATTKMMYLFYGWDQLPQAESILSLLPGKAVYIYFSDFAGGHRWAELQHQVLP